MATHEQFYLTCDGCGELLVDEDGKVVRAETDDCVRGEAVDNGWQCNVDTHEAEPDYCPDCIPTQQHRRSSNGL